MTVVSWIFVYGPMTVASFIVFAKVEWGFNLLVQAIEALVLAIFVIILTIWEFRTLELKLRPKKGAYRPTHGGPTAVMSGIEMDEKTLLRGKMSDAEDDYEV